MDYQDFIDKKLHQGANHGFEPTFMPDQLFDFQESMCAWSIEKGRGALFEDCGMGKTAQLLTWAQNVVQHTNRPVLVLSPLAVTMQTVKEGEKFGIECKRSHEGELESDIVVTNYERLNKFDYRDFSGVVCDESSILKSFDGSRKAEITEFMRRVPYRLLTTATAAPNDFIELGTSSEALGYLGYMDMLSRFFKNDQNNIATRRMYGEAPKWRFKGHAELPFWRWVCSWARAMRKPSDLGFDDGPFILPEMIENRHIVEARSKADGMLFTLPATTLPEQREEKKRTIQERCEKAADILSHGRQSIAWCHLNDEAKALKEMPGAVEVSGGDKDEAKEEKFMDFIDGKIRVLVTKPKIGALGLNFQHCHDMTYFPSHSYEQFYQAVRRCWRFGQKNQVNVDIIMTEGEEKIMENLHRKSIQAEQMFENLVQEMNYAVSVERRAPAGEKMEVPAWL